MKYIPVIGLEIHAELATESKMFCRCPNTSSDLTTPPNTAVCPVCLGLPGALPVPNKQAIESTVRLGTSLGSNIPDTTKWDRKNYFYPDLPKSYQISQYDEPICGGGELKWFDRTGQWHSVALTRIHLEEDTGKLTHPAGANYSLIDYNRSSIPLLELVTEPVIVSAEQARQFCEEYQHRLRELGIAEASMEKGQMRCEANISVIPAEYAEDPTRRLSGTKVEVKNLNSFRSLERAITYEIERQGRALDAGEPLHQETRGWDEDRGQTYVMRTKETADDYRYFPDPDLGRLDLSWAKATAESAVSLRVSQSESLLSAGAQPDQLFTIMHDPARLALLTTLTVTGNLAVLAVQWIAQEPRTLEYEPAEIVKSLELLHSGAIKPALLKQAIQTGERAALMAKIESLQADQVVDNLEDVINQVLEQNPDEVERYRAGDQKLFGFFVGQVRQALQGKGDPGAIAAELKKQLSGMSE